VVAAIALPRHTGSRSRATYAALRSKVAKARRIRVQWRAFREISPDGGSMQDDIRTTQEIFGELVGGPASAGPRGVRGFVIAKALARLLIQQGVISRETFIETMRQVAREELEESDEINKFLDTTFAQILDQLDERAERGHTR